MLHCVQISFCVVWTDYPWRSAAQPLTSNVIKWFYLPDFAKRPNPSFIFCEYFFTLQPTHEDEPTLALLGSDFDHLSPSLCRRPPPAALLVPAVACV